MNVALCINLPQRLRREHFILMIKHCPDQRPNCVHLSCATKLCQRRFGAFKGFFVNWKLAFFSFVFGLEKSAGRLIRSGLSSFINSSSGQRRGRGCFGRNLRRAAAFSLSAYRGNWLMRSSGPKKNVSVRFPRDPE